MLSSTSNPNSDEHQDQGRSLAEWVTFGIATAILLAIVGLVIYDWVITPPLPPTVQVRQTEAIRTINGSYYVPFSVANTGGKTAAAVQVIAELRVNGMVVQRGEQQIDFLSGGESRDGAFIFSRDPRMGELTVRVASYKMP